MLPLRDENPTLQPAIVTRGLILLNCVVFLYEVMLGPELNRFIFHYGLVPLRITNAFDQAGVPWSRALFPFLTSMFLHGGWMHLIGNMWYLWIFGDNVEERFGHAGFLVFYLLSGFAAAAAHVALATASPLPTVGASGAIAGVLGAYAVAYPSARVVTLVPLFPFWRVMGLPAVLVLGFWFVLQFFQGALALGSARTGGVAWWAHIGGFVFGMAVMAVFGGGRGARRPPRWV